MTLSTPDIFRASLDGMDDSRHALVVLPGRLPWLQIEQVLTPHFARKAEPAATHCFIGTVGCVFQ